MISLDDEIAKNKKIKKIKGGSRKDRKGRREGKFRKRERGESKDLGNKSRKEIFGKKRFIKRQKNYKKKQQIRG